MFDIQHYETTKELMSNIPIECVVRNYRTHVLFSLPVNDLKKDDIISISSEFEVTQNNPYMTMIGSYIILTNQKYSSSGEYIVNPNGFNLDNKLHHAVPMHSRNYHVNKDYQGESYINLIIYSSSTASQANEVLKIEQNYGHLDALVFKKIYTE